MDTDSTRLPAALRSRLERQPLWDFALHLYTQPGVEAACLQLQDEAGVDVCELLWQCWLYQHGLGLAGETEQLAAIRRWQGDITVPLRRLRRALKTTAQTEAGVADVRRHLKRAELAAERECLLRLQRLTETEPCFTHLPAPPPGLKKTLADNLQLQKKTHLLVLETLQTRLDPPQAAR